MNNLCALLFVYCGLPVIKIKSAEEISLACGPSLFLSVCFSLTLSWLAVKPSEPFGPSHPPLARTEINCWLKKRLATPSLRSKKHINRLSLVISGGFYLLWIIRADTSKWYTARGICMTSLSVPCWRKSHTAQWLLYAPLENGKVKLWCRDGALTTRRQDGTVSAQLY